MDRCLTLCVLAILVGKKQIKVTSRNSKTICNSITCLTFLCRPTNCPRPIKMWFRFFRILFEWKTSQSLRDQGFFVFAFLKGKTGLGWPVWRVNSLWHEYILYKSKQITNKKLSHCHNVCTSEYQLGFYRFYCVTKDLTKDLKEHKLRTVWTLGSNL